MLFLSVRLLLAASRMRLAAVALVTLAAAAPPSAAAAKRQSSRRALVIVNPYIEASGEAAAEFVEPFARRLESLMGLKAGSIEAAGFASLEAARPFLKQSRPAFAVLSSHPLAQLWKETKVELVGHAGGVDDTQYAYHLVARRADGIKPLDPRPGGVRLATHITDTQWLNVIVEASVKPAHHFKLVPVGDEDAAVAAVADQRADVALVWGEHLERFANRLKPGGDLRVAFRSSGFPPLGVVSFSKIATRADVKALSRALPDMCAGQENIDMCAPLGFIYMADRPHRAHPPTLYKYETYK